MPRVQLIHWKAAEAVGLIDHLEKAGFEVVFYDLNAGGFKAISSDPPQAFVIDLTRLPSHGKAVALALRQSKKTRYVPLVFVDGDPEKVARLKEAIPDAAFTTWKSIKSTLHKALAHPLVNPVVPKSSSGPYSGTPLAKKLGIKAASKVRLIDAPDGVEKILEPLPDDVRLMRTSRGKFDLTVWFVDKLSKLETNIDKVADSIGSGGLWIAWPKKASGKSTDVSEKEVQKIGLASGLVDYKVCAIDETWSGLKFAKRKK